MGTVNNIDQECMVAQRELRLQTAMTLSHFGMHKQVLTKAAQFLVNLRVTSADVEVGLS